MGNNLFMGKINLIVILFIIVGIPFSALYSVTYINNPLVDDSVKGQDSTIQKLSNNTFDKTTQYKKSNTKDTDKDGFNDKLEKEKDILNKDKKDVVLVIDYLKDVNKIETNTVEQKFQNAPIYNRNSSNGINLHIIHNNRIDDTGTVNKDDFLDYYKNYNKYEDKGYYYAIVSDEVYLDSSEDAGFAAKPLNTLVIQTHPNETIEQGILMHEIGHLLGLEPSDYKGIDTYYDKTKYNSVMNYNQNTPKFGSNENFNDWYHISNSMYQSNPINSQKDIKIE